MSQQEQFRSWLNSFAESRGITKKEACQIVGNVCNVTAKTVDNWTSCRSPSQAALEALRQDLDFDPAWADGPTQTSKTTVRNQKPDVTGRGVATTSSASTRDVVTPPAVRKPAEKPVKHHPDTVDSLLRTVAEITKAASTTRSGLNEIEFAVTLYKRLAEIV